MRAFLVILRSILGRLLNFRRAIALLLIGLAPVLLLFLITGSGDSQDVLENHDLAILLLTVPIAFSVVGLVVASAALGEELHSHTLPDLLLKPVPRVTIALAATVAATLASFVILGVAALADWAVVSWRISDFSIFPALVPTVLLQGAGMAALFVPLGFLIRRATLLGLFYIFIWEFVLTGRLDGLRSTSLSRIALSAWVDWSTITPANADTAQTISDTLGRVKPGAGGAIIKTLVLLVISVAVTAIALKRRDIVTDEE